MQRTTRAVTALALASVCLASCDSDPLALRNDRAFTRMQHYFALPNNGGEIRSAVLADIESAEVRIDVAVSSLSDEGLANALVAAAARGVDVEVVSDADQDGASGKDILEAAGITVTLGDGELAYLPEPTITSVLQDCDRQDDDLYIQCIRRQDQDFTLPTDGLMVRPDDYNQMTHNFLVIDDVTVWNLASALNATNTPWFAWRAHSQEMVQAFEREFRQMAGGVFSTTLTVYNGPNKSENHGPVYDSRIPSHRPGRYTQLQPGFMTADGMMDVLFNPQSRLVKELIDEIYGARESVFLMSDQITNEYVIDALAYKARFFDVRVVVREGSVIPDELANLQSGGRKVVRTIAYDYLPTVAVTDAVNDDSARSAVIMTHATYHGAPFEVFNPLDLPNDRVNTDDDIVRFYPSDLFVDGSLWMFREYNQNTPMGSLTRLATFVEEEIWNSATEVP